MASRMSENPGKPKRRGTQMRKGTHSCIGCRRRKARCVFRPEISSACVECFSRGTSCRDQSQRNAEFTKSDKSSSLDETIAPLEPALESIPPNSRPVPQTSESLGVSPSTLSDDSNSTFLSTGNHEHAPLVSMIEKTLSGLCPNDALPARKFGPENQNKKRLREFKTSQSLRALFPSANDLNLILELTSDWWNSWHCLYSVTSEAKAFKPLSEFVSWGQDQRDPAFVALALLCVVISIQQTQPGTYDHKLNDPIPLRDLMDECLSTVDRLIVADSEYSGSCLGIELAVFLAQCRINLGQPQKAWLLFHRAISLAQLVGLNREGSIKPSHSHTTVEERRNAWWALNTLDRFLSLVLGLPPAVNDDTYGFHTSDSYPTVNIVSYRRELSLLAAQIVERNKGCPDPSLSRTLEIDLKLNDLDDRLPPELQNCVTASSPGETYYRLMTRFWHHQLIVLLHLPFALRPQVQPQFQNSHDTCLFASREMLRLYHIMRLDSRNAFHMCRVIDFQAFTAALLLLLSCLGYGGKIGVFEDEGLRLVDATVEIFRDVSAEYGGMVAAQSAQVLTCLRSTLNSSGISNTVANPEKIAVPYFGTITLSSGGRQPAHDYAQMVRPFSNETEINSATELPSNEITEMDLSTDLPHIDIDWDAIVNMDLDQEWNWFPEISKA